MIKLLAPKFLAILIFSFYVGCTASRDPSSSKDELPPVVPIGVPFVPADESPVVPTTQGFIIAPIPGIPTPIPTPLNYVTFVGPSN